MTLPCNVFAREAKALQNKSSNIVTLYEFGDAGGQFYFAWIRGRRESAAVAPGSRISARRGAGHRAADLRRAAIRARPGNRPPRHQAENFCSTVAGAKVGILAGEIVEPGRADLPVSQNTEAAQQHGPTGVMARRIICRRTDHRAGRVDLARTFMRWAGVLPDAHRRAAGKKIARRQKVHIDVRLDEIVLRALEKNPDPLPAGQRMKTCVETIAASRIPRVFIVMKKCVPLVACVSIVFAKSATLPRILRRRKE